MKRAVMSILIAVLTLFLSGCTITLPLNPDRPDKNSTDETEVNSETSPVTAGFTYLKAVWISQYELSMSSAEDKSEAAFKSKVLKMLQSCADNGINTVIVQVRPASDAFYPSDIFPATKFLSGTQGVYIGYDAFGIVAETAKTLGLSVQAWINPYRVSSENGFTALCADNPAKVWYEKDNSTRNLIVCDKGVYYNPASVEAQKLIIDGVREVVGRYDIDAVHFDDYFYPSKDASIDERDYGEYTAAGGALGLDDWRRANVNSLISGVYTAVKSLKSGVEFGISCSANMDKDFDSMYADIYEWSGKAGYVDYLMPQIYFGYENENMPFTKTAEAWAALIKESEAVDLYCGIAAYKAGTADENAGTGKNEWLENSDILARQLADIKSMPEYAGFSLFSYSYIFSDGVSAAAKKELEHIRELL